MYLYFFIEPTVELTLLLILYFLGLFPGDTLNIDRSCSYKYSINNDGMFAFTEQHVYELPLSLATFITCGKVNLPDVETAVAAKPI